MVYDTTEGNQSLGYYQPPASKNSIDTHSTRLYTLGWFLK